DWAVIGPACGRLQAASTYRVSRKAFPCIILNGLLKVVGHPPPSSCSEMQQGAETTYFMTKATNHLFLLRNYSGAAAAAAAAGVHVRILKSRARAASGGNVSKEESLGRDNAER